MTTSRKQRRKHVLGIEAQVLVSFIFVALLALLFAAIASEMLEGDTLAWDRAILLWFREPLDPSQPVGPAWLYKSMKDITALGSVSVLTVITVLVAGYLLTTRRAALALFVLASAIGGSIAGTLLKEAFSRQRPEIVPHLVDVQSLSFPSGHALNSAVIYLTLGALIARTEQRPTVKIYIVGSAILLAMLIGLSRVYLGVHYPTDVIAGWCAGAAWAAGCASLARQLQHRDKLERN